MRCIFTNHLKQIEFPKSIINRVIKSHFGSSKFEKNWYVKQCGCHDLGFLCLNKVLSLWEFVCFIVPYSPMWKLCWVMVPCRTFDKHKKQILGSGPSTEHSYQVWFQFENNSKIFSNRVQFEISLLVVAILDFWSKQKYIFL